MDTLQTIAARKSTRDYLDTAVEEGKLDIVAKSAQQGPKAGNFQISVILNPEILREINDKAHAAMQNSGNDFLMSRAALPGYRPLYGAPVLIVFSGPDSNHYSPANAACAATTAGLAATALGLASCYVVTPCLALNPDPALRKRCGIPDGYSAHCGLLLGYPAGDGFKAPFQALENINYCR